METNITAVSRDYILYAYDTNIEFNNLNDLEIKLYTYYKCIRNNGLKIQCRRVKIITNINNNKSIQDMINNLPHPFIQNPNRQTQ